MLLIAAVATCHGRLTLTALLQGCAFAWGRHLCFNTSALRVFAIPSTTGWATGGCRGTFFAAGRLHDHAVLPRARRVTSLASLLAYTAWANRLLYRALGQLPPAELERPRSIGFGSLLRTLHHQYAMDIVWRAHLLGVSHNYTTRNPDDCPGFAALTVQQGDIDAWYLAYATQLVAPADDEQVTFDFIGGAPGSMSRAEILWHVVNHTSYHRGHIGQMMYDSGVVPPTTDLPVFLRVAGTREL